MEVLCILNACLRSRTIQQKIRSEANVESFYNKYGPFPRQVYAYAQSPQLYEGVLVQKIKGMTMQKLQRLFVETLDTTSSDDVSHQLILISPTDRRSKATFSIPTRYL